MSGSARAPLSLAEQVCLALVAEGITHGWAVGTVLAPDGDLGRIWTLSRPLTYRAVDALLEAGLLRRATTPAGKAASPGRTRVMLATTAAGRRLTHTWLGSPVVHLRDVRTELLVKLELRRRRGLANDELLTVQQRQFGPILDGLSSAVADGDLVEIWRSESARAVRRFLERALGPAAPAAPPSRPLGADNELRGSVASVRLGDVVSVIEVSLADGQMVRAVVSRTGSLGGVGLGDPVAVLVGSAALVIVKAD